jgi:hypothetical protein
MRTILLLLGVALFSACAMPHDRYVELLTRADSAMAAHQERLKRDFRLGAWPRFDYDEDAGILVFSEGGVAKVLADVQFVGEVSRRDSTWTWAWDLQYVSDQLARAAAETRRYGWLHGLAPLCRSGWAADYTDGWEMTSLTGWIAGAEGGYRAPSSDSAHFTFMLLRNVRWAPPGRTVQSYLVSPRAGS